MYKKIFSFCSILIISAVSSQSTTDTVQKNFSDNKSELTNHNIEGKELPINQGHVIANPTIYSTFIPQDAVQSYVTGYTGQALEGFLIPTYDRSADYQTVNNDDSYNLKMFRTLLPAPRFFMAILLKILGFVASAIGILFFGTLVCTFTPICNPAFPALLRKETKEIAEKIGEEITPERIKRAADLFSMAITKYQAMQKNNQ